MGFFEEAKKNVTRSRYMHYELQTKLSCFRKPSVEYLTNKLPLGEMERLLNYWMEEFFGEEFQSEWSSHHIYLMEGTVNSFKAGAYVK